jgi:cytochrome c-type biogenesis protein CcmH/NrfG
MHNFNHRRCTACGELAIKPTQRFMGGWFFIRCPNCQRQLRVDPQHGQRWILLTAFVLIGAAALAGAALTGNTLSFIGAGVLAGALLYVWEFVLTRHAPLEPVTSDEAREYRRNWVMTAVATLVATIAVVYAATQIP